MVISLQATINTSPLDGLLAKSQVRDSETIQGLSFGQVLKVKEKQLQQEQSVSPASIAAALAAMHTLTLTVPTSATQPETGAGDETAKVEMQAATQAASARPWITSSVARPETGPESIAVGLQTAGAQIDSPPLVAESAGETDSFASIVSDVALSQVEAYPAEQAAQPISTKAKTLTSTLLKPESEVLPAQVETIAPKILASNVKTDKVPVDAFTTAYEMPQAPIAGAETPVTDQTGFDGHLQNVSGQPAAARPEISQMTLRQTSSDGPLPIAPIDANQIAQLPSTNKLISLPNLEASSDAEKGSPHLEIVSSPSQSSELDDISAKVGTNPEKAFTETKAVEMQTNVPAPTAEVSLAEEKIIGKVELQASRFTPVGKVSQPASETPGVVKVSPVISAGSETTEVAPPSAVLIEPDQAKPLQPMPEITPIRAEVNPEKIETQSVESVSAGAVPELTTYATTEMEVDVPVITAQMPDGENSLPVTDISAGKQPGVAATQVGSQTGIPATPLERAVPVAPVTETPQSATEAPAIATISLGISSNNKLEKSVERTAILEEAPNVPQVQSVQVETSSKKAAFSGEQVDLQASKSMPDTNIPHSANDVPVAASISPDLGFGTEAGKTPAQTTTQTKTAVLTPVQNSPEVVVDQIASKPEKTEASANRVEMPSGAPILTAGVQQSETEKVETPASVEAQVATNTNSKAGKGLAQTVSQTVTAKPTQDLPEHLPAQPATASQKPVVSVDQPEKQVTATAPSSEVLPVETDNVEKVKTPAPVKISQDTSINGEAGHVVQPAPTITSAQPTPEAKSGQVGIAEKKLAVESKAPEAQAPMTAPVVGIPQVAAKVVEKAQDVSAAEANPKTSSQSVLPTEPNQKFENVRVASVITPEASDGAPVLAPSVSQKSPPVVAVAGEAVKAQPSPDAIMASQPKPANEKPHPAEKQQEVGHGLETISSTIPSTRETFVVKTAEKTPTIQVNAQASDVVQQIMHQLNARIQSGPTSMHLQLNPKELGAIDIQMVSSPQGVSITFSAEQPSTGHLLETQMNQLRQSLTDAGIQFSGLNIGQHGQPGQEGGSQNPHFAQSPQHEVSLSETDIQETLPQEQVRGKAGEVDYLI